MAYKGDRYVEEERRRSWPAAAATPASDDRDGPIRVGPRRCSSLAYRQAWYATLLPGPPRTRAGAGAPGGPRASARRGRGDL